LPGTRDIKNPAVLAYFLDTRFQTFDQNKDNKITEQEIQSIFR
jgi:hypothetical protein